MIRIFRQMTCKQHRKSLRAKLNCFLINVVPASTVAQYFASYDF